MTPVVACSKKLRRRVLLKAASPSSSPTVTTLVVHGRSSPRHLLQLPPSMVAALVATSSSMFHGRYRTSPSMVANEGVTSGPTVPTPTTSRAQLDMGVCVCKQRRRHSWRGGRMPIGAHRHGRRGIHGGNESKIGEERRVHGSLQEKSEASKKRADRK